MKIGREPYYQGTRRENEKKEDDVGPIKFKEFSKP